MNILLLPSQVCFKSFGIKINISDRGKVYTWGSGGHGRLGHGDAKNQSEPKMIESLSKIGIAAVKVSCAYDHFLLLSDKGEVWSWGSGSYGETGQSNTNRCLIPKPIIFEDQECEKNIVDIATGLNFSVIINKKGECFTFGKADFGNLGNGKDEGKCLLATKIDSNIIMKKVFASRDHVIALGNIGNNN